jgi:hypothetical protein
VPPDVELDEGDQRQGNELEGEPHQPRERPARKRSRCLLGAPNVVACPIEPISPATQQSWLLATLDRSLDKAQRERSPAAAIIENTMTNPVPELASDPLSSHPIRAVVHKEQLLRRRPSVAINGRLRVVFGREQLPCHHVTFRAPFMPDAAWPGTAQRYS